MLFCWRMYAGNNKWWMINIKYFVLAYGVLNVNMYLNTWSRSWSLIWKNPWIANFCCKNPKSQNTSETTEQKQISWYWLIMDPHKWYFLFTHNYNNWKRYSQILKRKHVTPLLFIYNYSHFKFAYWKNLNNWK